MKKKSFVNQLVLKKKTIAHLNDSEMKRLNGGDGITSPTKCRMNTCYKTCV